MDQFRVAVIDFQVLQVEEEVALENDVLTMVVMKGIILITILSMEGIQIINHHHIHIILEVTALVPGIILVGVYDRTKNI